MEEQAVNNQVQQPNIPTPQEFKRHSFLTSKLFLITLVMAVLFTIVYAGIYLYIGSQLDQISKPSPTPLPTETSVKEGDLTANWKTFTSPPDVSYTTDWSTFGSTLNIKIPYTFKYPNNWSEQGFSTQDISFYQNGEKVAELSPGAVTLNAGQKCFEGRESYEREQLISQENISLTNHAAVKRVEKVNYSGNLDPKESIYRAIYCIIRDEKAVTVIAFYEGSLPFKNEKLYDQILSTFRFTD